MTHASSQPHADSSTRLLGWAGAGLTVLIGAGWQLATRSGVRSVLAPVDLALLRYLIPALLLAPLWWRSGLLPAGIGRARLALMIAGAGLPFGLLAIGGARFAPVAHMGAVLPGAAPLLVALFAWVGLRQRPGGRQAAGLALVLAGIVLITLQVWQGEAAGNVWIGDLLFLGAAALWALCTLALRGVGLSPWQSAAVVSAWSALGVVPLWLAARALGASMLLEAPLPQVLVQVFWQGLVAGIGGLAAYSVAVRHIGPMAAASAGALVPGLVALGGWWLLGEPLDARLGAGIAVVVAGVWLASRGR